MNSDSSRCNLCKSGDKKVIHTSGMESIVKCRQCGLIYKIPMPSHDEEIKKYRNLPVNYEEQKRIDLCRHKIYKKYLTKVLRYFSSKDTNNLLMLDIGCGSGYFIKLAMEKYKITTFGIEICQSMASLAKKQVNNNLIYEQPLRTLYFKNDFFDIVTLWDVLDHIVEPLEECKEIFRILKNNGILLIRVRNASFHITLSCFRFLGIIRRPTIVHLYSFSKKTLFRLLKKAGFKKIQICNSILTTGDPYQQAKMKHEMFNFLKNVFMIIANIIFLITFGEILISPSLIVYAQKYENNPNHNPTR